MSQQRLWKKWGLLWRTTTRLDGLREHLIFEGCAPVMFQTRHEARAYANEKFGYIKTRQDLQREPHCWRVPQPVQLLAIEWRRSR